ncbi:uncharacterized protein UTRI_06199 [Ustilago trichophora]|uniref:Uncharacterized protein n=1 Tax=Ustilago trichophora TaxID=86804 RepID=A0A5C3EG63_9BASI|nr:uncharacterized protein UTRI_06199 [Ustilago trichophora]
MSKLRLVRILCIFLMTIATCTAVQPTRGSMSDEASLLRGYPRSVIIQRAVTGLENHLGIHQGQLRPFYDYNQHIDGPFLRHHTKDKSRFLMYEHEGTTYFASPWMIAARGEVEPKPSALLLQRKPDGDVEPIGHVRVPTESVHQRLQRAAFLTQPEWLRQFRNIVLPAV